jgi:hypothetical protein
VLRRRTPGISFSNRTIRVIKPHTGSLLVHTSVQALQRCTPAFSLANATTRTLGVHWLARAALAFSTLTAKEKSIFTLKLATLVHCAPCISRALLWTQPKCTCGIGHAFPVLVHSTAAAVNLGRTSIIIGAVEDASRLIRWTLLVLITITLRQLPNTTIATIEQSRKTTKLAIVVLLAYIVQSALPGVKRVCSWDGRTRTVLEFSANATINVDYLAVELAVVAFLASRTRRAFPRACHACTVLENAAPPTIDNRALKAAVFGDMQAFLTRRTL